MLILKQKKIKSMRTNFRQGRQDRSGHPYNRFASGRGRHSDYNTDYDAEDYILYDEDEYDDEGSFRGEYEGEQSEFDEGYSDEAYGDDYDDYSVVGRGRGREREGRGGYSRGGRSGGRGGSRGSGRGFASMNREEVRELARRGGQAAHGAWRNNGRSSDARTYRSSGGRNTSRGRGYAAMTRQRAREIAEQGNRARRGYRDIRRSW